MEQQNNFVKTRATFTDQTKNGQDKLTMILGDQDVQNLINELQRHQTGNGLKLCVFLGQFNGKPSASMLVQANNPRAYTQNASGGGAQAPQKQGGGFGQKKSFAFKPKQV